MKKNVLFIAGIIMCSFISGLAISDIGEKPDPLYCEKAYTAADMIGVSVFITGIFFLGFFAGKLGPIEK